MARIKRSNPGAGNAVAPMAYSVSSINVLGGYRFPQAKQDFLKFLLGNKQVTAVIPGTGNADHMIDNLGAARGRLPDAQQRERMAVLLAS